MNKRRGFVGRAFVILALICAAVYAALVPVVGWAALLLGVIVAARIVMLGLIDHAILPGNDSPVRPISRTS